MKVSMVGKTNKQHGFTIVELLIVIVVIGILAAITVVAYNGVQNNATNAKTTQALTAWIKTLSLYKADNGHWPTGWVCLGTGYGYGLDNDPTTGTGQCRQTGATGYTQNTAFDTSMKPYVNSTLPTPAFVTARSDDTNWRRGLMYAYGGGDGTIVYIEAAYAGQLGVCPVASGMSATTRAFWGANTYCNYYIGKISDT
jgi:prepilin-type N-terminal cleavage/methylation domain-containing protein